MLVLPLNENINEPEKEDVHIQTEIFERESDTEEDYSGTEELSVEVFERSTFSATFFDVGQANAALIECDGHYMLIDGGNKADSSKLYSILKNLEVDYLDIVVGTHMHEDHIGGLAGALNYASAGITLCPVTDYDSDVFNDFKRYAESNGGGIIVPQIGDIYSLGKATVTILGLNAGDENDASIVLKIQYGETAFLFTGDAGRDAERVILDSKANLLATVLSVGHHGSESSTTYPFLREIMPKYTIISVGDNNYGHPTEAVLSRLRDAGVDVFRTDLQGDIQCITDGRNITIKVEKNAEIDTFIQKPNSVIEKVENTAETGSENLYILNTNTHKFHYPHCSSVNKMKDSNKVTYSSTRQKLLDTGYSPCGNCNP
ncbi:MAG: MBL fold metallo-hydrolase [Firmicutes bacterium]|nr:MBL fold metallo-hydrolase [Bacillota bacterium]